MNHRSQSSLSIFTSKKLRIDGEKTAIDLPGKLGEVGRRVDAELGTESGKSARARPLEHSVQVPDGRTRHYFRLPPRDGGRNLRRHRNGSGTDGMPSATLTQMNGW